MPTIKRATTLQTIALLALLSVMSTINAMVNAQDKNAPWTWFQNGKQVADSDYRKMREGFGAVVLCTEDKDIGKKWNRSNPAIMMAHSARCNVPLLAVVFFVNPGKDSKGDANVSYEMTLKKPDGSLAMNEHAVGWHGNYLTGPRDLEMGQGFFNIVIEDQDPKGKWGIDLIVQDHVRKVSLPLHTYFTVK